jgi:serine phosphatase RsbU (regulator of sigma subunit)
MASDDELAKLKQELAFQASARRGLEQLLMEKGREAKQLRAQLSEKSRELGRQATLGLLVDKGGLLPAATKILETICVNLEWDAAVLWMVDDGATELGARASWSRDDHADQHAEFLARMTRTTLREGVELAGRVWETGAPAAVLDLASEKDSARAEIAGSGGLHSACGFPVIVEGRVACVVELYARDWRTLDAEFLDTFGGLGKQVGRFLDLQRAKEAMLKSEMSVARRVQTSLVPRRLSAPGLEIAARMLPAEEVGGDYFDVLPFEGGCWLGIGDVTGHGLAAGIVMVMVQSAIAALSHPEIASSPRDIVRRLNEMLFENIRKRLRTDDHVTLSLLRYRSDGRLEVAGAHEDIVLYRKRKGSCEQLCTHGTWVGAVRDIDHATVDQHHQLEPGDVFVLYTDGLTEAMDASREQFGLERVSKIVEELADASCEAIRDRLIESALAFAPEQKDDITVLVARYRR